MHRRCLRQQLYPSGRTVLIFVRHDIARRSGAISGHHPFGFSQEIGVMFERNKLSSWPIPYILTVSFKPIQHGANTSGGQGYARVGCSVIEMDGIAIGKDSIAAGKNYFSDITLQFV